MCHKEVREMPRETFFNLTELKRNKIIDAAISEFTENELHKSRVSNIIKLADIPRGSFYQYFEDIDDLYYFVIDREFDLIFEEGKKYAELTNDIFDYVRLTFDVDFRSYQNKRRHRFIRNVMKSIGTNYEYIEYHQNKRKDYIMSVMNRMDKSDFRLTTERDLFSMYEFLQHIKQSVIRKSIMMNLTAKEAKENLEWHLDIIKNGVLKK